MIEKTPIETTVEKTRNREDGKKKDFVPLAIQLDTYDVLFLPNKS